MASVILRLLALVLTAATWADYAVNYDKADTSRWLCRLCEFDKATARSGRIVVGGLDSARAAARFGRDTGIDRAGQYLQLTADWQAKSESETVWRFAARDLGLDSGRATLAASRAARYGLAVRVAELPRRIATDARFPFRHATPVVPTSEPGPLADDATISLGSDRQRAAVNAWLAPTPRTHLRLGYSQERKTGVVETYRDAFYQAAALPQSIDQHTDELLVGWRYGGDRALLDASFERRLFANRETALAWQSPHNGLEARRSATAPDNAQDLLRLVAKLTLGARTVLRATAARGDTRQDAPFLPYTTNPRLNAPLPADSLNGQRRSRYGRLILQTRLAAGLRLTASHTSDERADSRIAATFAPVLGDLLALAARPARGSSFTRRQTALRLRYRTPGGLRLAAGLVGRDTTRSNLEIDANRERRVYLEAGRRLGSWRLTAKHVRAHRDAAGFVANTANNPLTRRYYQADRVEVAWRGELRYRRGGFAAGLNVSQRDHDYPDTVLGLQRAATRGWNVDLAYAAGHASAAAGYGIDRRRSTTTGNAGATPGMDWRYHTRDTVATAAVRLDFRVPHRRIDLSASYASSDGRGAYATLFETALSRFPDLVSRQRSLDLRLRRRLKSGRAVLAGVALERYQAADWAIDGVEPASIRNVFTARHSSPTYANRLLYLAVEKPL